MQRPIGAGWACCMSARMRTCDIAQHERVCVCVCEAGAIRARKQQPSNSALQALRNAAAAFCAPCASRLTAVQQSVTITPCESRPRARRGRCWARARRMHLSISRCWGYARAENNNLAHSRWGPDQVEQHVSVKKKLLVRSALAPAFCRCCGAAHGRVRETSGIWGHSSPRTLRSDAAGKQACRAKTALSDAYGCTYVNLALAIARARGSSSLCGWLSLPLARSCSEPTCACSRDK